MTDPSRVEVRERVLRFIEDRIYPLEPRLDSAPPGERRQLLADLMQEAKRQDLWALGHPRELGGHGMSFLDYVHISEVR